MPATLQDFGLEKLGCWIKGEYATVVHLRGECPFGIAYSLPNAWHTKRNVVYAFVIAGSVRYVGETTAGMAPRFNGYRYGNPLVTDTDNRVKLAITRALQEKNEVEIWAAQPVARLVMPNRTELEMPASKPLEEHLIALLSPELNVKVIGNGNSTIAA